MLMKLDWSSSSESGDKPKCVPDQKCNKLRGKAISMWVHIRNWPVIMSTLVKDRKDSVLALGLKLNEVTERITSPQFRDYEIQLLEDSVIDYLDRRKKIRQNYPEFFNRPKPKHHYLR